MRGLATAIALSLTLLAGCLGGDDATSTTTPEPPLVVTPGWAERALPFGDQHDHANVSQHLRLSTPNFEVLGWDPLVTEYHGGTSHGYFCGGVSEEGERKLAVVHSFTTDVALVVVDVTDPAAPMMVGELVLPQTHVYDADITADGRFAVLATSAGVDQPDSGLPASWRPIWRDRCGVEHLGPLYQGPLDEVPYSNGVVLVDLADPTVPTVADYAPHPGGVHSIHATHIDGTDWVLGSSASSVHVTAAFQFLTIEDFPIAGPKLVQYGIYDAQYKQSLPGTDPRDLPLSNGHTDGTIQVHPVTGELLGHLANWDGGYTIVRLAGEGRIEEVGHWSDLSQTNIYPNGGGYHETLPLDDLWGGRHITVIGQEITNRPTERPTGNVILMDTTDPADPTPVARWTLPVDPDWGNGFLRFSTHYVAMQNQTLFVSLYHGGVWAANASEENWPNLPSSGVFLPTNESPMRADVGAAGIFAQTPVVLDVLSTVDGHLVVFDGVSGVYTVAYDDQVNVPPVGPWTGDDWVAQYITGL